jgi:hypothetical protein
VGEPAPDTASQIFPSRLTGKIIDAAVLFRLLQTLEPNMTVDGFRTGRSFWGDHGVDREVAELNLAHRSGSAVEQEYNRTSVLERRKPTVQRCAQGWTTDAKRKG